jgi:hypothetical protein
MDETSHRCCPWPRRVRLFTGWPGARVESGPRLNASQKGGRSHDLPLRLWYVCVTVLLASPPLLSWR